jgi:hypothetical protein
MEQEYVNGGNIAKASGMSAVSFENRNRDTPQIKLIVNLIKRFATEQRPITAKDIIDTYMTWRTEYKNYNKFYKSQYVGYDSLSGRCKYLHTEISAEEYKEGYEVKALSKTWFKNNLAAAIIKGRLMVLPLIDLDENDDTQK